MKIFVAYEGTTDLEFANEIKNWVDKEKNPYDLFDALDELKLIDKMDDDKLKMNMQNNMSSADLFVVVIGPKTKSFRKFVRWQVEYAVNSGKPVIAINLNGIRSVDFDRCPTFLKKNLSMHITAQNEIFEYALENWPQSHYQKFAKEDHKTYRYTTDVYDKLGLHTADFA